MVQGMESVTRALDMLVAEKGVEAWTILKPRV